MKISLDLICLGLQRYGGISNYWTELIKNLDSQNIEFEVIKPRGSKFTTDSLFNCSIEEEKLPAYLSRFIPVNKTSSEVLHSSYYRIPSKKSITLITSIYDFVSENRLKTFSSKIHNFQKKIAIERSSVIICISNFTKSQLIEKYNLEEKKIFVTHLGVDSKIFYHEPDKQKSNMQNNLLFVGNRSGYKRFDLAVESLKNIEELELSIVGPPLSKKEKQYLSNNLKNRWVYLGFLSKDSLRKVYSNSFAFIFPSDEEGFGLPLLEAMSSGCPVICSKRSSFPEIGGKSVLYSSSQDPEEYIFQIKSLMDNNHLRKLLREEGINRSKLFSWKNTFDRTFDIYNQFI